MRALAHLGPARRTRTAIAPVILLIGCSVPPDDYLGTDPLGAIVDAYGDPAVGNSGRLYFYGGGHGDGTCNAVVELDPAEFSYRLVGDPTPASAYPPGYLESGATPTYPSGLPFSGWFLPAAAQIGRAHV